MNEKLNENLLRITGAVVLPEGLDLDSDYTLGLTCNIQKREQRSCNSEGKYDVMHTGRLLGQVVIQNKWGKNIAARAKGSPSQMLRNRMRINFEGDDFDGYYTSKINLIIANWEYIKDKLEHLENEN